MSDYTPPAGGGGSSSNPGSLTRLLQFEFDGAGLAIDIATIKDAVIPFCPFSGTIQEAYIKDVDDIAGSQQIDVRAKARTLASPTSGDSLVGAGTKPATVGAAESTLTNFTNWTGKHINAGDEVRGVVTASAGHKHTWLILSVLPD